MKLRIPFLLILAFSACAAANAPAAERHPNIIAIMADDPGERNDPAGSNPEQLKNMQGRFKAHEKAGRTRS